MPTGGHGLRFATARIVVGLRRVGGLSVSIVLPLAVERDPQFAKPLPDPQPWMLATRDGVALRADGWVGLPGVEYRPWTQEIDIVHTPKADQTSSSLAKTFSFAGLAEPPRVTLNGQPAEARQVGQAFQIAR